MRLSRRHRTFLLAFTLLCTLLGLGKCQRDLASFLVSQRALSKVLKRGGWVSRFMKDAETKEEKAWV